jgi:hypothetical protein
LLLIIIISLDIKNLRSFIKEDLLLINKGEKELKLIESVNIFIIIILIALRAYSYNYNTYIKGSYKRGTCIKGGYISEDYIRVDYKGEVLLLNSKITPFIFTL